MPKRRSPWHVDRNSGTIAHDFFLSHVSEDSEAVGELKATVARASGRGGRKALDCFLDVDGWRSSNDINEVVKEFMLKSRFFVAWITPDYLMGNRGWVWMELAYADLLESSLNANEPGIRLPYVVPLFHRVTVNDLERTPLLRYWQRNLLSPPNREYAVSEIAQRLVDFHDQESRRPGHPLFPPPQS